MQKLRVGIVGMGHNGAAFVRVYGHHDRADLVAVCDFSPEKMQANKAAADLGDEVAEYTDLDEMLVHADLDVLSVHTPDYLHAGPFCKGLAAGCHTFTEKPMGNTMADLEAMTEAARNSDRKTMVGQILRFNPFNQEVHRLCSSGALGELFYLEADYIHGLKMQGEANRINSDLGNINWYLEHEKVLVGGCAHQFDLLRWFAGSYAVEVMGAGNHIAFPEMKHPDCACAIIKLASGAICKLTGAYGVVGPRPDFNNLEIYGTAGAIRDGKLMIGEGHNHTTEDLSEKDIWGHPYEPEVDHFLACIQEDRPTLVDAFEGANSAAAMILANEAAETGKIFQVPHFVR